MYESRLHLTNGIVSLSFDALNGELLDFVRESTADNVIKNHMQRTRSLLDGMLSLPEGDRRFTVPRYREIRQDPSLTPEITVRQGDGEGEARLRYPALVIDGKAIAISAEITVTLLPGDCRSRWRLRLDNRTGCEADDIAFPSVDGLWLGEDWTDDVLVYPHFAGCRVDNPTEQLASEPHMIHWKWQEYVYSCNLGQATGTKDERGAFVRRLNYTGEASMLWMDLHKPAEGTGIYITCRNTGLVMKGLRMESFGGGDPGTGLAIIHRPALQHGVWESGECVLAFHEGDWHWAADDYREWFSSLKRPEPGHHRPDWFLRSAGLMAHYDFQYQNGGIVHRFADIPELLDKAQAFGLNHLLLAGWNTDGFDFGFPHYTPNEALGGEGELKKAVAAVRERGGHVSFYINSRLCNTGFADQADRIRESAVMQKDGRLWIEKYGANDISFASLCINDTAWRGELQRVVRYLTREVGADSMYLDQLAMATSVKCYHPGHKEHAGNPAAWNQGYEKLLAALRAEYDPEGMALIYEGCNDIFGDYTSGQLVSELHCPLKGRMPEVYKYTFPSQILVDMMNPRRRSAMRCEMVARHSTELLHNAFTMGAYFWCYDLEADNNWRDDREQGDRLRRLTALRSFWLEHYGQGTFRDIIGLKDIPAGQLVKRYELEDGVLLACAGENGLSGSVLAEWNGPCSVRIVTENEVIEQPWPAEACAADGKPYLRIPLPECEAAVIVIRRQGEEA